MSSDQFGLTCVSHDSPYQKWIQTLGFEHWSKDNCEHVFKTAFLTNCSVIRTNGVVGGIDHNEETRQINNNSKLMPDLTNHFVNNKHMHKLFL